jgi:hypothetical protein
MVMHEYGMEVLPMNPVTKYLVLARTGPAVLKQLKTATRNSISSSIVIGWRPIAQPRPYNLCYFHYQLSGVFAGRQEKRPPERANSNPGFLRKATAGLRQPGAFPVKSRPK